MEDIRKLIKRLAEDRRNRKVFFTEAGEEIARKNLTLIWMVGIFGALLILFFICFTPVFFKGWKVTWEYIAFLVGMIIFAGLSWFYRRNGRSYRISQGICNAFQIVLLGFIILIDVFPYEESTCSYMPVILVVLPAVFTVSLPVIISIITGSEIIFILLVLKVKKPGVWGNDIFNSLVGLIFSFVLVWLVMQLRVEDYRVKARLKRMSREDKLTGVLNKGSSETAATEYFKARDGEISCGLVIIDIDNFKLINDRMGHHMGDQILSGIGELLNEIFRATDIVGRIGGDEFMVLMRNVNDRENLERMCARIQECLKEMQLQEKVGLTCSIGAAYLENDTMSFEEAFQTADDALYEAKALGKCRYVIHRSGGLNKTGNKKVMLLADKCKESRAELGSLFHEDFDIIEAEDGAETLSRLSEYKDSLAVAVIDSQMERMNGFEVLKYMKSRDAFAGIPVIITTSEESGEEQALTLGANDILKKPMDPVIVKLRVARVAKK